MKRYVAALLMVLLLGVVGVLAIEAGHAQDEAAAGAKKCSNATLDGTYLFAQDGVEIKGNDQRPFAIAGKDVFYGNGRFKTVSSSNFNGQVTRKEHVPGTYKDRKSTRLNSSHANISYAVFCLKKKKKQIITK